MIVIAAWKPTILAVFPRHPAFRGYRVDTRPPTNG